MEVEPGRSTRPGRIGPHLAAARLERGLSQSELAARCGPLSQAQISYFELDRRKPTLDQLIRIAGALGVSLHRLVTGADRPGDGLRDVAIELRNLGLVDLWVEDPIVPGTFRRPEEVVALAHEVQADLIVVGAHSYGPLERFFHGSVSDRVAHRAPGAVLVVHLPPGA